jgi:hypothetical protein
MLRGLAVAKVMIRQPTKPTVRQQAAVDEAATTAAGAQTMPIRLTNKHSTHPHEFIQIFCGQAVKAELRSASTIVVFTSLLLPACCFLDI